MKRPNAAFTGIIVVVVAGAVYGWIYLRPAKEAPVAESAELTNAMKPQIELVQVLDDGDVPAELTPLAVGGSKLYVLVTLFYPGLPAVPEPMAHRLVNINGNVKRIAATLVAESDVSEDGASVDLFFLIEDDFEFARLVRGTLTVAQRLDLE